MGTGKLGKTRREVISKTRRQSTGHQPCPHLDLGLAASRKERELICSLSCPVYATLLWQPKQVNAEAVIRATHSFGPELSHVDASHN